VKLVNALAQKQHPLDLASFRTEIRIEIETKEFPMKYLFAIASLMTIIFAVSVYAETPPQGATATCKDGSFYSGSNKKGACSHHGGIQQWYGTNATAAPSGNAMMQENPPATAKAPNGPINETNNTGTSKPRTTASSNTPGNGQVWVNTDSKVYHCPGTHYYGTTKHGEYMSESQALASGARADHNKACR
jgi:hypothetical protein